MKILVIHPLPEAGGGAEIQLFRNLLCFQNLEYNITLVTLFKIEDGVISKLAESCGIKIDNVSIKSFFPFRDYKILRIPTLLSYSLVLNYAKKFSYKYDFLHTILGECTINHKKVIQHFCIPQFSIKKKHLEFTGFFPENRFINFSKILYIIFCRLIANYNKKIISQNITLSNSKWTANVVKKEYPNIKKVQHLYFWPKSHFKKDLILKPFHEREPRIIMLGRIVKWKNHKLGITLIDELIKKGLNYNLTIIGRSNTNLSSELYREFKENKKIEFIFDAKRDYIFELCSRSRFGFHAFKYEHFGSASVEMRSVGLPTFVPAFGGQNEISDRFFTYKNISDVVEKICFFEKKHTKYFEYMKNEFDFYQKHNDLNYIKNLKQFFKKINTINN